MNSEAALDAINRALFPPRRKGEGPTKGLMISGDACSSLGGLLFDLKRLRDHELAPDRACIKTVERVRQQLLEVKGILREAGLEQPSPPN